MAATLKIIESIDPGNAAKAFAGLGICLLSMISVLAVYGTLVKGKSAQNIGEAGKMMMKMSVALLLMAFVIKMLGKLDDATLGRGLAAMTVFVGIIGVLTLISKLAGKKVGSVGKTMTQMAGAFALMALVIAVLGKIKEETLAKGLFAITMFAMLMVGMVAMTKLAGKGNLKALGSVLVSMAGAMLVMALVVKLLGGMDTKAMAKGLVAITYLAAIIVGLVASTKLLGHKGLKYVGTTLVMMGIAIGIMAAVVALLGALNIGHLAKGLVVVAMLGGIVALMVAATKNANDVKGTLIAMSIAIGILAVAVVALSFIPWQKLAPAVAGIAVLMGMFALVISSSKNATGSIGTLIVMTIAIGLMAGMIYLLAQLPIESTIASAVSLSVLLLAVSGALFILSKMNTTIKDALLAILSLTLMAVPMAAFVGVLALMQNVQNATTNALALSLLMAAMSLILIPLTLIGKMWSSAFLGVAALTLMAVPMVAFVGVLALMTNVQSAQANANLLCGLMTTMTLLLIPLTLIGLLWPSAFLGVAALTLMAVPMLAFIGVLAVMENIQIARENVELLCGLMTVMTVLLVALGLVGPLAMVGVGALAALTGLIVAIGVLATGVGALMEKFPELESFLDKGLPLLEKIAYGIGSLAGSLISGLVDTVAGSLPGLGQALSDFMVNAAPFIEGIKTVDASVLSGIGILTGAILLLTAVDLINGIASLMQFGSNFSGLGTELSNFMTNAQPFIEGIKGVDASSLQAVGALADAILKLTAANVVEGLTSWFAGGTSLAAFGEDLAAFGPNMKTYADAVAGIDTEAVRVSANAAKTLAEMADSLPNSGGLIGWFAGENDMETFGTQLKSFGSALKDYSGTVTGIDAEAITASVNAGTALSKMAADIPNLGGVVSWFTGDNDMATFGAQLVAFGGCLSQYSTSVGTLNTEAIDMSVTATNSLSKMASDIPNLGGVVSWFTGDNGLATFGVQLTAFGNSLVAYATSVTGLAIEPINASVTAAKKLAGLSEAIPKSGLFVPDDLTSFARDIKPFGEAIKAYSIAVAGINIQAIATSVSSAKKLIGLIKDMGGVDSGNAKEFKKALDHLGESAVDDFIDAFDKSIPDLKDIGGDMMSAVVEGVEDKTSKVGDAAQKVAEKSAKKAKSKKSDFKDAGKDMIKAFADGIEDKTSAAKTAVKNVAKNAADAADDKKTSFTSAGKDMVAGFASGITANTFKAEAAAKAMAQAALDAAKEKLKINSPSKVFRAMATSIPEGFAMGIDKLRGMVVDSATGMATSAIDTVRNSISRLGEIVNTDIDTQPTIRPVLDLSDVRSNAGAISKLLGFNPSVGVLANVGGINSLMNSQNGGNADVVAAINKLRKGLDNVGNTTYTINGITYDDGSAMQDAVGAVIRQARLERRV